MKPNVWVVMWTPNTSITNYNDDSTGPWGLAAQDFYLKQNINLSYKYLLKHKSFDPNSEIMVFVAPEWYFRAGKDDKSYTFDFMKKIFGGLREFIEDNKCKSLLVIPGSFYYVDENDFACNCTAAISEDEIISVVHKIDEADIEDEKKKNDKVKWFMYEGIDKTILDKFYYKKGLLTEDDITKINKVCQKNYIKLRNYVVDEFKLDEKMPHIGFFNYKGLSFAIEICKDHSNGRLMNEVKNNLATKTDIHIIIAADVTLQKKYFITDYGGYILYNDGHHKSNAIFKSITYDSDKGEDIFFNCNSIKNQPRKASYFYDKNAKDLKKFEKDKDKGVRSTELISIYDTPIVIEEDDKKWVLRFDYFNNNIKN